MVSTFPWRRHLSITGSTKQWLYIHVLFQMWFFLGGVGKTKDSRVIIGLPNVFCLSISVPKPTRIKFLFSWQDQQHIFCCAQMYVSSPAPCHNLIHRDLDHLFFSQSIIWFHHFDDVLAGQSKREAANILDLAVENLHVIERYIKPNNKLKSRLLQYISKSSV